MPSETVPDAVYLLNLTVAPIALDASARLVDATNKLIRTAMGVGAFLCLIGLAMCLIAFWMFSATASA